MKDLSLFGGAPVRTAPFPSWPVFDESEERALVDVTRSGQWWRYSLGSATAEAGEADAGGGSKVAGFQEAFARAQGARFGIACSSGMAALEVGLKALGVGAGDEVVVPPYTFIATATAPMVLGATPVFADVELDTLNLCPENLERAITPRTRAIVPVHFAGGAANMEAILGIAARHGLPVVEDAAHAHGARWNGQGLGSLGACGAFSFQASKNMTAGEGGLILTNDAALAELCESYVWVGRKAGRPWYEHHRAGWNYRMTEFQGAILIEQLKRLETQNRTRRANAVYLNERLSAIPGIHPLRIPAYAAEHSFHIYIFRFDATEFGLSRSNFLEALAAEGIPCSSGYAHPLYRNPLFQTPGLAGRYADCASQCPHAERACGEMVWLEHRLLLGTRDDMNDIVRAARKIFENRNCWAA
ncbi:MAG TPA: DegT/DnrJ/EryC1/StrS family aminotransferase [Bryobacteraceae bacterium]|nr:DegT/DnrJ/EryC1/StrS family aminotransferase [Bryobacteraceae bacterium]